MAGAPELAPADSLFARLREACAAEWDAYVGHEFVRRIGDGSLPEACFRHYLIQDYLFLIQFARAYALAAYKSDTLADIRQATAAVSAIVDTEVGLHVRLCAGWGLSEDDMAATQEAEATVAYTRYVLDRGASGDLLDLHVALSPCVVGYAEIGAALAADPAAVADGNPYAAWIETYAGDDYQAVARAEIALLDRLAETRAPPARFPSLANTFRRATVLEARFWDMGLSAAD